MGDSVLKTALYGTSISNMIRLWMVFAVVLFLGPAIAVGVFSDKFDNLRYDTSLQIVQTVKAVGIAAMFGHGLLNIYVRFTCGFDRSKWMKKFDGDGGVWCNVFWNGYQDREINKQWLADNRDIIEGCSSYHRWGWAASTAAQILWLLLITTHKSDSVLIFGPGFDGWMPCIKPLRKNGGKCKYTTQCSNNVETDENKDRAEKKRQELCIAEMDPNREGYDFFSANCIEINKYSIADNFKKLEVEAMMCVENKCTSNNPK